MKKILLIDDDFSIRLPIEQLLANNGYEVKTSEDGFEAVSLLSSYCPDMIISDVSMPKLDGWDLCDNIRKNPSTKDMPIIILTGKQGNVDELMSYERGANAYISKPFKDQDLLDTIKQIFKDGSPDNKTAA